jgi:hypothetical protein
MKQSIEWGAKEALFSTRTIELTKRDLWEKCSAS